jgi:hypothetical protein
MEMMSLLERCSRLFGSKNNVGKAKIDSIKELISLMFNDNKSALTKLQKTIDLVS